MLTTAQLNDDWLEKNVTIQQCEQLLEILKSKTTKVKEQQDLLAEAVNGMTEKLSEEVKTEEEVAAELERLNKELEDIE